MTTFFKGAKLWKSPRKSTNSTASSESFEDTKEKFKNLSEEAALKVLLDIVEVMKCKVCKFVISLPMALSSDGEVVCETCLSPTESVQVQFPVPSGARPLSPADESLLTSVILAIPRECRNTECPVVVVPGDDHKLWCGFQQTSCKLCEWVGASRDLPPHTVTDHRMEPRDAGEFTVTRELDNFDPDKEHSTFTPVRVADVFLWVVTSVDTNEKEFRNNYVFVPNGKQATKISVEVIFGDEGLKNVNSIKKELNLNPIYSTSTRNSIVFPTSVLDDYVEQNNVLRWKEVFIAEN